MDSLFFDEPLPIDTSSMMIALIIVVSVIENECWMREAVGEEQKVDLGSPRNPPKLLAKPSIGEAGKNSEIKRVERTSPITLCGSRGRPNKRGDR